MYDILITRGKYSCRFGFSFQSGWAAELTARKIRNKETQATVIEWPVKKEK